MRIPMVLAFIWKRNKKVMKETSYDRFSRAQGKSNRLQGQDATTQRATYMNHTELGAEGDAFLPANAQTFGEEFRARRDAEVPTKGVGGKRKIQHTKPSTEMK